MKKNKSNIIFCGVISGYQGKENIITPQNAADIVAKELKKLGSEVKVFPAVCVYHTDWGCPNGGEPVGAFVLEGFSLDILNIVGKLRKVLKQTTLSVALIDDGCATLGFTAEVEGDILVIGKNWQKSAAEQMSMTGVYVSCGIAQIEEGKAIISAEANPNYVENLVAWHNTVHKICADIGIKPIFKPIGFVYLCDAK